MTTAAFVALQVANQLVDVTAQLPTYRATVKDKIASLKRGNGIGVLKATAQISEFSTEMVEALPGSAPTTRQQNGGGVPESRTGKPMQVQVIDPLARSWDSLLTVLTPVGLGGLVLVFTIFILLRLEDLRNRFIRLVGHDHLNVTTQALDDASQRIGRYLFLQCIVNLSFGIAVGAGLHFIGLPNALLWGVLASACRFLPYIGTPIAAFLPIVLSIAVFDGWTRPLMTVGLYVVTEIVVANFVEPLLYAAHTGISSLAILVAAVFWTLLWGTIGLVLSTPLTVCLVVIGRHVPQMEFLQVLLGDEPVLSPEVHFYQRMLASDLSEARRVLEAQLSGKRLQELFDSVVIPALGMAQRERYQNDFDETVGNSIFQSTRELVEELNEEYEDPQDFAVGARQHSTFGIVGGMTASRARIASVPAKTGADETIGAMLAQLLERQGEQAQCISLGTNAEMINQLVEDKPDVIVVSALQPFALTHARRLYTQLRARLPQTTIMVGLWNFNSAIDSFSARLGPDAQGLVVTNLAAAIEQLGALRVDDRMLQANGAIVSP
jgi:predicted PurR-regulated permease PerM/methylmalonyl-CoA mutase cobalamin-binding subunit